MAKPVEHRLARRAASIETRTCSGAPGNSRLGEPAPQVGHRRHGGGKHQRRLPVLQERCELGRLRIRLRAGARGEALEFGDRFEVLHHELHPRARFGDQRPEYRADRRRRRRSGESSPGSACGPRRRHPARDEALRRSDRALPGPQAGLEAMARSNTTRSSSAVNGSVDSASPCTPRSSSGASGTLRAADSTRVVPEAAETGLLP